MPRLFVGNFDFEERLIRSGSLPQHLDRLNAELSPVWAAIADDGDAVWTAAAIDSGIFDRLAQYGLPRLMPVDDPSLLRHTHRLVFWGENDWAKSAASKWGFDWHGCDPNIVRRINSRRFKFECERRFDCLPENAAIIETVDQFERALQPLVRGEWVLKSEFGGAGREVRFGRGEPSQQDRAWAANRIRRKLALTVEPRFERVDEAGIQFQIERDGTVVFLGVTPLVTRSNGGYLGSSYRDDPHLLVEWSDAIETGHRVANAVAAGQYRGPLGIDAMRFRDATGAICIRPVQDLNARYTMGRLALGLRRFPEYAVATNSTFQIDDFRTPIAEC